MNVTLKANASDAEINAAVAEHVAPDKGISMNRYGVRSWSHADGFRRSIPDYLHDANTVIKLLEKLGPTISFDPDVDYWHIAFNTEGKFRRISSRSFTRAACYALLRAHGVTVEKK